MTAKELIDAIVAAIKRATAGLDKRLTDLQAKVDNLPKPEKGDKGDAGKDGEDGRDGEDGKRGPPGESVKLGDLLRALKPDVEAALARIPAPQPPAIADVVAALQPALEAVHAKWALEFERRAQELLQREVERFPKPKDGKDGRDGADGLSADDFTWDFDGERTLRMVYARGEVRKEFTITLSHPVDRGVYREGAEYSKGDTVTWAGSLWIAQKDAPDGKPEVSRDWRLAVKRGRDGAKGDAGKDFRPPAPVKAN